MSQRFSYRVCQMQNARITFVGGEWQGQLPADYSDTNQALNSCPMVWDYLEEAGRDGWELVGVAAQTFIDQGEYHPVTSSLFLKKSW